MYNCIAVSKCLNNFEDIARTISLTFGLHKCESKERRKKKVIELIASKDKIIKESIKIFYTNMYINVFK